MVECAAIRSFDRNLWNCVWVVVSGYGLETTPSVCIVSFLDCSTSSRLVFQDCFYFSVHTHMHTCQEAFVYAQRDLSAHILVGSVWAQMCFGGKLKQRQKSTERPLIAVLQKELSFLFPILLKICRWKELPQHLHTDTHKKKWSCFRTN